MTVIGRLDKQVDDVLIRPLSKRPHAGEDSRTGGEQFTRTPPPEDSKSTEAESDAPAAREELPVWLL